MTRKSEGATAGLRRGRTLATAGLGAATLIGGLVYAAPAANAATAPTVTVTAPTNIDNTGATASPLGLKVANNTGANLAGLNYVLTIGLPTGATCANITWAGQGADSSATPALVDGASTNDCVFQGTGSYTLANTATADASGTIKIAPSPAVTGTVTETLAVYQTDGTGTHQIATGSGTSQLVAPHAPAFNSGAVPSANVFVPYSYDIVSDAGFPAADPATGYEAEGYYLNSTTKVQTLITRNTVTAANVGSASSTTVNHYIDLQDELADGSGQTGPQFYFDTDTGNIVTGSIAANIAASSGNVFTAGSSSTVYTAPNVTWTIIATNGTTVRATGTTAAPPVPALTTTQVGSPQFQLPVDFKDVSATSPFKADIDALAGTSPAIVKGYGDGTFGVAKPVTRGQFAAFIVRELIVAGINDPTTGAAYTEGACTTGTNGFSDVPDTTQFCKQINELATDGVINGYKDGTFRPATELSRQVVAGMFFRTNDVVQGASVGDAAPVDTAFPDVKSDNVFSGDIQWAVNSSPTKIIAGYTDGTFRPTGVATRQVTAAYLARFGQDYLGLFANATGL